VNDFDNPVSEMSEEEAWQLLESHIVGRLAASAGGVLDIYPLTYVVDNKSIVFRTGPGTKLVELTINDQVVFEIDHWDDREGYSVIVHGTAHQLDSMAEIDRAQALALESLFPTERHRYVRITPNKISGRRFRRE
jgi:nitroimidazol reductase NimA-like FMN-containing flavoprotein (pyridoxamine 5'-phosphate oxidase superfamily)